MLVRALAEDGTIRTTATPVRGPIGTAPWGLGPETVLGRSEDVSLRIEADRPQPVVTRDARSPQPTAPTCSHKPCASKSCSACVYILRASRTAGGLAHFETQCRAAVGTVDGPELRRAATSDIHLGVTTASNAGRFLGCS